MPHTSKIALIATLHDPAGRMVPFLSSSLPLITELYHSARIIGTPASAAETLTGLEEAGLHVDRDGTAQIGANRRRLLARALGEGDTAFFHYCDFDRLLYWATHHPGELRRVVTEVIPRADYTALGRTPAAFASHPPVQRACEELTNDVFAFLFQTTGPHRGIAGSERPGEKMDVTAGSCGISRAAARRLVAESREPTNATDAEWPMLVAHADGLTVAFARTEGLAFETATFFGASAYAEANTADNWQKRVALAHNSIAAAIRVSRRGESA